MRDSDLKDGDLEDSSSSETKSGGPYAHMVLFVLVLVYIFNFIDRNILSILAEDIKADLGMGYKHRRV